MYHPTVSSARLSDFSEFWLKVYLQIFAEQAGNGIVLCIFRGRYGLVETNQPRQSRVKLIGVNGTVES